VHVDHLDHDKTNSRLSNMEVKSSRGNAQNLPQQSDLGVNIVQHKNSFCVHLRFGGVRLLEPTFPDLAMATKCRDAYLQIAAAVDAGDRPAPAREELKAVADQFRVPFLDTVKDRIARHQELRAQGMTIGAISDTTGCPKTTVSRDLARPRPLAP
jgi:hypothetical protein